MGSAWDDAEKESENAPDSTGMFLQLTEDGQTVVVAFVGEPKPVKVFWNGKGYEDYDENKHDKYSLRVKMNVFNEKTNSMQIFDMNNKTFKTVLALRKKYGLQGKLYEVKRNGAKGDPQVVFQILPERDAEPELLKRIESEKLLSLESKDSGGGNGASNNRDLLIEILKTLPRDKIDEFLKHFDVQKIKELPDAKMVDALAFANKLKKGEADPFADSDDIPF
jgi:hypothetical protein